MTHIQILRIIRKIVNCCLTSETLALAAKEKVATNREAQDQDRARTLVAIQKILIKANINEN